MRACESRDTRFDGWFIVGVTSTGIYCRPSCPTPVRPKRTNMRFYASAAAAQRAGFRACKRCRPDASPGSPAWSVRSDIVGRALRLIADGVLDRDGVSEVARQLAISQRHLGRLLTSEVGAGPLALARAQRAQTARTLIETTDMPFNAVAFAAGFSSVRQFNDTVREVFATTPRALRKGRAPEASQESAPVISLRLAYRRPFAVASLVSFLADRAIPGVEVGNATSLRRTLRLPHGDGHVTLHVLDDSVQCQLALADVSDTQAAVQRCRRLLDLDADPVAIDETLGRDPYLRELVRRRPGLRSPGSVDPTEAVTRAIVGQQISVTGARTILGRLVAAIGTPMAGGPEGLTHTFPTAAAIAEVADSELPMPTARRHALREACRGIADGHILLHAGADRNEARRALSAIPGIGPWTAEYVAMRALGDPDAFPASDLGIRHALAARGIGTSPREIREVSEGWRPWRSYATHHLWNHLGAK